MLTHINRPLISAVACAWAVALEPLTTGATTTTLCLFRLLKFASKSDKLAGFFGQTVTGIAKHVESVLANIVKAKQKDPGVMVSLQWAEDDTKPWNASLHEKLIRYVAAAQLQFDNALVVGMPTDKGSGVGGQSLQNSLICLQSGLALLPPSQASSL